MIARRGIATVALALLAALVLAAPAAAERPWEPCPGTQDGDGIECASVRVPLDRSGAVAGSVRLAAVRFDAARRGSPHLMYLSGGPGGAGIIELVSVMLEVPELANRYRVLGFDQRGTGDSGVLRCRELERDGRLRSTAAGERCARRIGPRRAFYTTPDSVEDMEAIRRAAGARKLTLFGISYGTKLALAYARAYPHRVDRMILDSVVDPDENDPFGLAGFRAMGLSLAALCPAGCRGLTADPAADLTALTAKLRAAPLRGSWYDGRGRRHGGTLRPVAIADLMYDADYNPALRAALPVAVRAALDNDDAAPLLRLLAQSRAFAQPWPPRLFSAGRYATVCEETPLPWPRGTALENRFAVARDRALALPPSAFAPFDAEVAYADEIDLCLRWPDPGTPPQPAGGAYPQVPTLLLQGMADIRTPPEASARVATLIPGARRVELPGVGHAVIGADPSGCGPRQVMLFVAGRSIQTRCPAVRSGVPPTAVPPASFAALPVAAPELGKQVGRTVSAIDATLDYLDYARSPAFGGRRGGGLRGGRWFIGKRGRLRLAGVVVAPGVVVSGEATGGGTRAGTRAGTLALRVRGDAAAHGRVRVSPGGRLTGRLGGTRVAVDLANRPSRRVGFSRTVAQLAGDAQR